MKIISWLGQLEPAIWIALLALATSVVVAWQNWRHNKLSVIPNVDLHRNLLIEKPFISIESTGIGPAIIEKIEVKLNDKNYNLSTIIGMENFLKDTGNIIDIYHVIEDGVFLVPATTAEIIKLFGPSDDKILRFVKGLDFKIYWRSVYGDKYSITMKGE